jgi:hypothetical protein
MRNSVLARGLLAALIGLPLSLIVGTGASYLPESRLEGLAAGIIVSSALLVAVLVLIAWTRGARSLRTWFFTLHSFFGLATGILLAIIVLSGALLLFRGEIETWSHDWLKVKPGAQFATVDAWLDAVSKKVDLASVTRVDIAWPRSPTSPAEIRVSGAGGSYRFHVDPYRSMVLEGELSTWMDWVRELHASLHMKGLGSFLGGLTGLGAMWLFISGLLMRRGLFRDWRVLRFDRGMRIFVSDLHMRLAIWLVPFIAVMAFSGMLLAFSDMLSAGPVRILFDGSRNQMYAALGYPQRISKSERAPMPALELFTRKATNEMPDALIRNIRVIGFGDRNAIVSVYASRPGDLAPKGTSLIMHFRAVTQDVIGVRSIEDMGMFQRFRAALDALHIADFEELLIRILYAIASVALTLLPILGIVIWVLRRRDRRTGNIGRPPERIT